MVADEATRSRQHGLLVSMTSTKLILCMRKVFDVMGLVCLHYLVVIWVAGYFNPPYIAQFMGCVIGRIRYGLKVVFCFRHFTVYHYHHNSRVLTGIENNYLSYSLIYIYIHICIYIYGVVCVQLAHFNLGDWEDISIVHVIIIIKSEVSTLPIIIIITRGCVPEMFVASYSVTYCIYIPGKSGFCFHYYCAVYDECK